MILNKSAHDCSISDFSIPCHATRSEVKDQSSELILKLYILNGASVIDIVDSKLHWMILHKRVHNCSMSDVSISVIGPAMRLKTIIFNTYSPFIIGPYPMMTINWVEMSVRPSVLLSANISGPSISSLTTGSPI